VAAPYTPYRTLTGQPMPTPGCGCCASGVAICTCSVNYFDLVTLTLSCPACAALDGKVFVGFAGAPRFNMLSLGVAAGLSTLNFMYLGSTGIGTSACDFRYQTFGGPSPSDSSFGVPPTIACPTVSWTALLSLCGSTFLNITATMAPAASNNITAPAGTCATLDLPGCPVITISASGGSLDGSWQLVPTFSTFDSLPAHFNGWENYLSTYGLDLGDGHHMTITVPLSGIHAFKPTVTVTRDSDAATATGTALASTPTCSPFSVTGTMAITGTDASVVCPAGSFSFAITP
jgi:hypothetical protein